jgi:hypothetical protein
MNDEEQKAHDEAVARAKEGNSKFNTDRLKRMEEIANGSDEVRATELDDVDLKEKAAAQEEAEAKEYARRLQAEGATAEEEPEQVETEAAEPQPEASDTKMVNGELHYLQIINGREKWQTLQEIRTTASKVEGADEYLRNAAEAVKNASRLAPSQDEPSKVERVDLRNLLRAAVLGEEEAIEALASALEQPSGISPDVVRTIDQRLSFRTELAELEGKSRDLLDNPYTKRLFRDRLSELKAENPTMGLSEAYASIDQELRTAFPTIGKTQTQDKLARKRTLVNVPTAASRQVTVQDEEGEEDVSTVIQKIAKARGSTPVMHGPRRT